jgi:serine/threonine protein phosphatase PrpC
VSKSQNGGEAARAAGELAERWPETFDRSVPFEQVGGQLRDFVVKLNEQVHERAEEREREVTTGERKPRFTQGATTATVGFIYERPDNPLLGRWAFVAAVGDSPAYVHRADGSVERLTVDDHMLYFPGTERKKALAVEQLLDEVADPKKLTPAERKRATKLGLEPEQVRSLYRDSVLTQHLGGSQTEAPNVQVVAVELKPGDKLEMVTDGARALTPQQRAENLRTSKSSTEGAQRNVADALDVMGRTTPRSHKDDVSAVVIEGSREPIDLRSVRVAKGEQVPVRRGTGELEDGWSVRGFNAQTGDVIFEKPYERGTMQKHVPQAEVQATKAVQNCRSFGELARTVRKMPERLLPLARGQTRESLGEQLARAARGEQVATNEFTRALGLRRKFEELTSA